MADAAVSSGMGMLLAPAQNASGTLTKTSPVNSDSDVSDGNTSTFSTVLAEQGEPVGDLDPTRSVVEASEVFSTDNTLATIDSSMVETLDGGEALPLTGNSLPVIVDQNVTAQLAGLVASVEESQDSADSFDPLATDNPLSQDQAFLLDPSLLEKMTQSLQSPAIDSTNSDARQASDLAAAQAESALAATTDAGAGALTIVPVAIPVVENQSAVSAQATAKEQSTAASLDLISLLDRKSKVGESPQSVDTTALDTPFDLDTDLPLSETLFSKSAKTDFVLNLKDNFNNAFIKSVELTSVTQPNSSISLDINAIPSWRQQGAESYSSVQPATTSIAIDVPVTKQGWGDAVLDKVMWMSSQKMDSAEIALDPADLGPMHVRISTHHDQTTVVFTSQHAQVREALDQASGQLRQSLENQGFGQVNVDVSGQNAGQQLASQAQSDGSGNSSADGESLTDEQLSSIDRPVTAMTSINKLGLIDTFV